MPCALPTGSIPICRASRPTESKARRHSRESRVLSCSLPATPLTWPIFARHEAEGHILRDSTPTSYLNFLFDIAQVMYRARFLNPTPEQISDCLRDIVLLGEAGLPTEDGVSPSAHAVALWNMC